MMSSIFHQRLEFTSIIWFNLIYLRIQKLRKDTGLDVVDRIELTVTSNDNFVEETLRNHKEYVKNETLAVELKLKKENTQDLIYDKNVSLDIKKLANNS